MVLWDIQPDDPLEVDVRNLIETHLRFTHDQSPPEDVHALDPDSLAEEGVEFFSIRSDGNLLGVGALKDLGNHHAELKSIHISESARGRGIGRAMVDHLIDLATERGFRRVSLETGAMEAFAPSRSLYRAAGFVECEPFGDYLPSAHSVWMTLQL